MAMPQPWVVDSTGEVLLQAIEHPVVSAGDWPAAEEYLGLSLPSGYKQLVGDGLTLEFDEELLICSPFDQRTQVGLFNHIASTSWAEASLRASLPEDHPGLVYPELGGILAWGVDGGGCLYHWDTSNADPDCWTVVVTGRPINGFERHQVGVGGYLAGLADGSIEAAALSGWPEQDPQLRRL